MYFTTFKKFINYYGQKQKLKLFQFVFLSLMAGLLEFCGIALISPFILLIINPDIIINTTYYSKWIAISHIHNLTFTVLLLGVLVVCIFVLKNLFMIFTLYAQNKFINNWKYDLNKKLMHYYLYNTYKNSLNQTASEKIYKISCLVNESLEGFIFRVINLGINTCIVSMILLLLFWKFFLAAAVTSVFIFFSLIFQNKYFKKRLEKFSQEFYKITMRCNDSILENLNNIKDIKISSSEQFFYEKYCKITKEYTNLFIKNNFYKAMPVYVIEIFVVFALFILATIISLQNISDKSWMMASYAVIAASIFRIAPALNRIQNAINGMNASYNFVKTMNEDYEKNDLDFVEPKLDVKFTFTNSIKLKNINFSYNPKKPIIKNLDMEIKKGEFIGIIGLSGAGKTTLVDILMGLLPVDSGHIYVDDFEFNEKNYSSLRKLIGYVPQESNIIKGSFLENVGFGESEDTIDESRVIECLKQSQLYNFVNSFKKGIYEEVRGLSQGQKQRLSLARTLYRNATILILDEATSSLDVSTESEITKMLSDLRGEKTIIAIAHRLSTLKSCDRLLYIKNGRLRDSGSFDELSTRHEDFEKLIKLSNIEIK